MQSPAEILVLAGAEVATQLVELCRAAGHRLFGVAHSLDDAIQQVEQAPQAPGRAGRIRPGLVLVDLAQIHGPEQDERLASFLCALAAPVVHVASDLAEGVSDDLASSKHDAYGAGEPIITALEPRELALAIRLAQAVHDNQRLRARQHGPEQDRPLHEPELQPVLRDFRDETRWQQLLGSTPAVLYSGVLADELSLAFVSDNVSMALGYQAHQFVDEPRFWLERIHPEDAPRVLAGLRSACACEARGNEYRFQHRDGSYRWILDTRRLLRSDDGRCFDVVGSWLDITERKQAEEALKASEARYKAIVEIQTELVCRFVPSGELTFVNEAYCRYFDKQPEELIGHRFTPLVPDEDHAILDRSFALLGPSMPMLTHEHRVILPGGEVRWQSWTNRVILDEAGEIIEYQSVGRDITERKQAEEALRTSEARYKAIVEDQTELVCRFAPGGTFTFVNEAYCRYFGQKIEDVVGQRFAPRMPAEDLALVAQAFARLSPDTATVTNELRVILPGGEVRWNTWTNRAIFDDAGQIIEYQAVGRDITERKQVEEALRQSEERYASIFHMAAIPIWEEDATELVRGLEALRARGVTDFRQLFENDPGVLLELASRNKLLDINDQGLELLHIASREQAFGSRDQIYLPESLPPMREVIVAMAEGKPLFECEMPLRTFDGEHIIALLRISFPSRDKGRKTMLVSGVDISERKRAQDKIQQLNEALSRRAAELEAANTELEAFSYSVSHDLRTPLRAIDGFSKVILDEYAGLLDARGQSYFQRVCQASQRMSRLIDDLLSLSRMTRSAMRLERCDMSGMAYAILRELRKSQPERAVEVTIEPGLWVVADRTLLQVMLENLLGNAWKFTSKQPLAHIHLGTTRRHGRLAYFVRDDGAGFDMAYSDKLFGAFQRLHSVDEFDGTGVGLATVRRIIRRHGGEIWAEGQPGAGATFTFTLS